MESFKGHLPLWAEQWDAPALKRKFRQIRQRAFDQGYRMLAHTDGDFAFPNFAIALKIGMDHYIPSELPPGDRCIVGLDLASHKRKGNAIFVGALTPMGKKYPLEIHIVAASSPEIANVLTAIWDRWQPDVIVIENNAYQDALGEWVNASKEAFPWWDTIVPVFTGKNKVDPENGLNSLDIEFQNGSWIVPKEMNPEVNGHEASCDCGPCTWIKTVQVHPQGEEIDTLMASWFFRHGCRRVRNDFSNGVDMEIIDPPEFGDFALVEP